MDSIAIFLFGSVALIAGLIFLSLVWGLLSKRQAAKAAANQVPLRQGQPIAATVSAIVLIGFFVTSLFVGTEFLMPRSDRSSVAVQPGVSSRGAAAPTELAQLARKVDKAADGVYGGLDTTKDFIGKTEVRKQAIERGRDRAHGKLKSLAERIQAAAEQNQPLSPLDQKNATHITTGVS
ncbi:MAG: hypothetical protein ACFBSF_11050 [Leptolyngbyaceae cyanobacterium]